MSIAQGITDAGRRLAWRKGFDVQRRSNVPFGVRWEDDVAAILPAAPGVAIDVGANEGQTARRLLGRFPGLRVYSFEPNPEPRRELEALAARHSSLEAVGVAASDRNGEIELVMATWSPHSTVSRKAQPGERTIVVPTIRLDDFCDERGIDRVSLLKVDTEGHETTVLRGAGRLLDERRVDAVLLEVDFEANPGQPHADFFQVHPFLAERGYRVVAFYAGGVDGNGWMWGDVLYRVNSDAPLQESPHR